MSRRRMKLWYIFSVMALASMSWVSCVTSRSFQSHDFLHQQAQILPQPHEAVYNSTYGVENERKEEEEYKAMSRIGSRPPNCGHKCEGCYPCEAVQTPTNSHISTLHFANYEPEDWKCKCGISFFDP